MIRITKLTDYGISLMTRIACGGASSSFTARDLAADLGLPLPTVSKLLKQLAKSELLDSQRGAHGGYHLACDPRAISVARLIDALEGPIAMTECSVEDSEACCDFESYCGVRGNWQWINHRVIEALESVSLAEMASSATQHADELKKPLHVGSLEAKQG